MKRHALRPGTVDRARKLRRNSTDAESVLWFALRDKLPAARFRRQVAFGPFFADFASHGAKLIVEVDGGQHAAVHRLGDPEGDRADPNPRPVRSRT